MTEWHPSNECRNSCAVEYDGTNNTVGNLTKTTELTGAVMTYGYDALYRLTSEARTNNNIYSTTYQYDTAGNLTQVNGAAFASYDDANKISSLTGGTISHDLDGNVTSLTMAGVPASTFTWNTQSKLRTHVAGGSTTTYTYNHLGLRAIQQQGTVKRYYVFAGDKLLGEVQGGYPQVAYTWGPDGLVSERLFGVIQIALETVVGGETIEAPLSQVEDETNQSGYAVAAMAPPDVMPIPVGNVTLWYHYGPQTETRYLTDEGGAVTDTYLYDAYGKTIATTGTFYNPHRYGGKYGYHSNLNAAGLILAGQRWYSPQLRRWISRDPIGYEGDDNLYLYSNASPTVLADPDGKNPLAFAAMALGFAYDFLSEPTVLEVPTSEISVCVEQAVASANPFGRLGRAPILARMARKTVKFRSTRALRNHNGQVRWVIQKLKLSKKEQRDLHNEISRNGLTLEEIYDFAKTMFKKGCDDC